MPKTASTQIAVIGIDIGKNSFHVVGHDKRGSIVLRQKWSRGQIETRLANLPPCGVGMEACVGRIILRASSAGSATTRG
jgi:transposase